VKVGVTLPQFEDDADAAISAAVEAEALGLDGVFCFDHLWPMGQPGRPALSPIPLLGALAAVTSVIHLGTLVARIGLLPDAVLVSSLVSLEGISAGRLVAGLGTGDHLSRGENEAFGIPFEPAGRRRQRLARVAAVLTERGIPVWVGGGLPATTALARTVGCAVNLWDGTPTELAALVAAGLEVTWAGSVPTEPEAASVHLEAVRRAGATWAVCAWPRSLEAVATARDRLGTAG
jgi:alkanesulfonate monooxygenase SsuD/methylene tetrahydromethanopterin reductase-like flavin-dependent oxidoreductase (luciferase family)